MCEEHNKNKRRACIEYEKNRKGMIWDKKKGQVKRCGEICVYERGKDIEE